MSRSNNTEIVNPAKYFYEWVGSKSCLRYYDKQKEEQVFVPLPFSFLVLDRLSKISGFSDQDQSSFWSNEVRDLKKEPLTVRTKKGIVATGLYSTMAPILNMGAQYCQSVYIAVKEGNEFVIANISIQGSAIGPWIELCKGKDIYKYAVTITEGIPMKKGATNYYAPVFKLSSNILPETEQKAIELDRQLQDYFYSYFKKHNSDVRETITPSEVVTQEQRGAIDSLQQDYDEVNTQLANDSNYDDDLPF